MKKNEAISILATSVRPREQKDRARYDEAVKIAVNALNEPERKTGKWIDGKRMKFDGTFYWFRQCAQCGYERNDCDTEKDSNFCPYCGADMRGEQDG